MRRRRQNSVAVRPPALANARQILPHYFRGLRVQRFFVLSPLRGARSNALNRKGLRPYCLYNLPVLRDGHSHGWNPTTRESLRDLFADRRKIGFRLCRQRGTRYQARRCKSKRLCIRRPGRLARERASNLWPHSVRNASIGSTDAARCAGSRLANVAASANMATAAVRISGS